MEEKKKKKKNQNVGHSYNLACIKDTSSSILSIFHLLLKHIRSKKEKGREWLFLSLYCGLEGHEGKRGQQSKLTGAIHGFSIKHAS